MHVDINMSSVECVFHFHLVSCTRTRLLQHWTLNFIPILVLEWIILWFFLRFFNSNTIWYACLLFFLSLSHHFAYNTFISFYSTDVSINNQHYYIWTSILNSTTIQIDLMLQKKRQKSSLRLGGKFSAQSFSSYSRQIEQAKLFFLLYQRVRTTRVGQTHHMEIVSLLK